MNLDSPYSTLDEGHWYKGSLHVHSKHAEVYPGGPQGRPRPEILHDYRNNGHDFVMFSEQNVYTTQADIDAEQLNAYGVLVIPGAELDEHCVTTHQHLGHVNPSESEHVTMPASLPEIVECARVDADSLVVLLHPTYPGTLRIRDCVGVNALEIVNGWYLQRPDPHHSPFAFDHWDRLLQDGERIWGVAGDCSVVAAGANKAWIVACAADLTVDSIVNAVRDGRFYASTGVTINTIGVAGMDVTIDRHHRRHHRRDAHLRHRRPSPAPASYTKVYRIMPCPKDKSHRQITTRHTP
ncbi:hypothetical protein [Frankia sp. QA3]|uniref:hypothetical protein n=1 Tax=Frankia sp. QA3 TaxID=710111 RepID=UPI0002D85641|nr:hypothetical protein [Frankia sp. QA3]